MKRGDKEDKGWTYCCGVAPCPTSLGTCLPHLRRIFVPWGLVRVRVKERRGDVPVVRLKESPRLRCRRAPSRIRSVFACRCVCCRTRAGVCTTRGVVCVRER